MCRVGHCGLVGIISAQLLVDALESDAPEIGHRWNSEVLLETVLQAAHTCAGHFGQVIDRERFFRTGMYRIDGAFDDARTDGTTKFLQ